MDRRRVLDLLGSGLVLTAAPSFLSGCAAGSADAEDGTVALLLPLSGASAELGRSMERAAALAQASSAVKLRLNVIDAGEGEASAGVAAARAIREDARLIIGPLFAAQVKAVTKAVAGRMRIISFTNDVALRGPATFVFGVTPSQSVSAILQYARARGVRRVALIETDTPWGRQAAATARQVATEIGLAPLEAASTLALVEATTQSNPPGGLPDAVLHTGGGAGFAADARSFGGAGLQVLGTMQAIEQDGAGLAAMEGAWLSTPDPDAFEVFARAFQAAHKAVPGTIAALAFDAVRIATAVATPGTPTVGGLLRTSGFEGVTGAVRFREDGRCVRDMTIVAVAGGRFKTVGRRAGI